MRSLGTDKMLQCVCTRGTRSHWAPATNQETRISTLISIVSNLTTIPRQKYGNQSATYPGWKRAQIQSLDFHHSLTMVDARETCWIKGNWNLNIPFTKITLTSKVLFFKLWLKRKQLQDSWFSSNTPLPTQFVHMCWLSPQADIATVYWPVMQCYSGTRHFQTTHLSLRCVMPRKASNFKDVNTEFILEVSFVTAWEDFIIL